MLFILLFVSQIAIANPGSTEEVKYFVQDVNGNYLYLLKTGEGEELLAMFDQYETTMELPDKTPTYEPHLLQSGKEIKELQYKGVNYGSDSIVLVRNPNPQLFKLRSAFNSHIIVSPLEKRFNGKLGGLDFSKKLMVMDRASIKAVEVPCTNEGENQICKDNVIVYKPDIEGCKKSKNLQNGQDPPNLNLMKSLCEDAKVQVAAVVFNTGEIVRADLSGILKNTAGDLISGIVHSNKFVKIDPESSTKKKSRGGSMNRNTK